MTPTTPASWLVYGPSHRCGLSHGDHAWCCLIQCCSSASNQRLKPDSGKPRKRGSKHITPSQPRAKRAVDLIARSLARHRACPSGSHVWQLRANSTLPYLLFLLHPPPSAADGEEKVCGSSVLIVVKPIFHWGKPSGEIESTAPRRAGTRSGLHSTPDPRHSPLDTRPSTLDTRPSPATRPPS